MKVILIMLLAALASFGSFVVHVIAVEWLPDWISAQMQGKQVQASWDVRYLAAATAIEYGLAIIALYYLIRDKLLRFGQFKTALLMAGLLLAINGILLRQPLMDIAIGNPLHVALVQNAFLWLPKIIMAFTVVYGYELIVRLTDKTATSTAAND